MYGVNVSKYITQDIPVIHIHEVDSTFEPEAFGGDCDDIENETYVLETVVDTDHHRKWSLGPSAEVYVAGFIAKRWSGKYDLGSKTSEFPKLLPSRLDQFPWLKKLSKGGLMVPHDEWLHDFRLFDAAFIEFHGDKIDKRPKVIDRFASVLQSQFGKKYAYEIYQYFAKFRTLMRIKTLNNRSLKADQYKVIRHWKQLSQHQV